MVDRIAIVNGDLIVSHELRVPDEPGKRYFSVFSLDGDHRATSEFGVPQLRPVDVNGDRFYYKEDLSTENEGRYRIHEYRYRGLPSEQ